MKRNAMPWIAGCLFFLFLSGPAAAYIGPGAGLSAIGTLLSLIGAVLLAIVGFVWYPVKRLVRSLRASRAKAAATDQPAADGKTK